MEQTTLLLALAIGLAALATLLAVTAHRRLSAARRSLLLLQGRFDGKSLVEVVAGYATDVEKLEGRTDALDKRQAELFALLGRSTRNLGVRQYDAFEDMGGKMSFSAALVDDHGDGVIITSINGRTESRTYAKPLESGTSLHNLSSEEQAAISEALGGKPASRRTRR